MLQNAYFLAKIGADTAENERNFAEILPKIGSGAGRPGRCRGTAGYSRLEAPAEKQPAWQLRGVSVVAGAREWLG